MAKTKLTNETLKKGQKQHKERRDWKTLFLEALSKSPSVSAAAKAARVTRPYVYHARSEDKEFAAAWDNAINVSLDLAEDELYKRGVKGYKKPIFQQGKQVGTVMEFSDTLLIFMLKSHRPEKYRETINVNWRDEARAQGYDPDELVRQFAAAMASANPARSDATTSGTPTDTGSTV